ncbi:MAG: YcaO-like family protein, partial [Clostridia bacterium]|nr:YcaO-like family protein [Clostridia bacterium]
AAPDIPKIDWNYRLDTEKRAKKGSDIFSDEHNEMLISPHSGIGGKIIRDSDSRIIPMYYVKSHMITNKYYSYGRSETLEVSRMSAEFEMLERYASIVPHTKPELAGSFSELVKAGYRMVSPEKLSMNLVNDEVKKQYGFDTYSDDKSYRWRLVTNLADGLEYYLPEQVMYYDAQLVSGEKRFMYETSNGCAMGGTFEEAVMYAMLELVERDAFLMHWYNRIAPKQLDISGVKNDYLRDVVRYMTCIGYEIRVMDITMETGIPAIWVAAIDRNYHGKMKCYNAAGAHINPEKALEGALVEVATSIGIYDRMIRSGELDEQLAKLKGHPEAVIGIEDHVYFYSLEENFHNIEPSYLTEQKVEFTARFRDWYEREDRTFTLKQFAERFRKYHPDIYVGVLESKVNRELGLWCVKAVVPSMLTMTFGVKNQRLNLERIRKGAVEAGITDREIPEEEINTTPHPFP